LIGGLLALGDFQQLEQFIHVIQSITKCFDDLVYLRDGFLDGFRRGGLTGFCSRFFAPSFTLGFTIPLGFAISLAVGFPFRLIALYSFITFFGPFTAGFFILAGRRFLLVSIFRIRFAMLVRLLRGLIFGSAGWLLPRWRASPPTSATPTSGPAPAPRRTRRPRTFSGGRWRALKIFFWNHVRFSFALFLRKSKGKTVNSLDTRPSLSAQTVLVGFVDQAVAAEGVA